MNTSDIINLKSIDQYNRLYGLETLHPLVAVVDLKNATTYPTHFTLNYGVYALFLKQTRCGDLRYGRQPYDYQEGTVTSFAPGQVVEVKMEEGTRPLAQGLLFHPDLIRGTSLGREIKRYSFFSYASNEALHLSDEEKQIYLDCLSNIQAELQHPIDKHSRRLIVRNIELLLDYCMRFYERQFITRATANKDVLTKFEEELDWYFQSQLPQEQGLPTVKYFADRACLSPNYFGDLVKKETGRTAQEYIQDKLINIAKEEILSQTRNVSEIAYRLGFQYPQHFTRIFKKRVGCTPGEYRSQHSA
ncbi:response regulator transcription factor [Phocaeicola acetigenes]|jgi:AraC-like DNA-binding protein|uniref:Helix-turn-helix transcriptional regulator n=1 Tax=Phocaeicola acetigenes TaxID=3016083 RepID=A0ABT4PDU2_9BACT|nr:response regulator transcription factor [Phocaeicola sp. KGMB11183]MCZ8371208.1 helix-turn-helix transcriptional regulator [Phocaeicola sp. KGMB11183]